MLMTSGTMHVASYSASAKAVPQHSLRTLWNSILLVLVVLFLLSLALPLLAKEPLSLTVIDRTLPGSRTGILTTAQGVAVQIDQSTFTLAPFALVEDRFGTPLMARDLKWNNVEFTVQYWVASDHGANMISQLIVYFPE